MRLRGCLIWGHLFLVLVSAPLWLVHASNLFIRPVFLLLGNMSPYLNEINSLYSDS